MSKVIVKVTMQLSFLEATKGDIWRHFGTEDLRERPARANRLKDMLKFGSSSHRLVKPRSMPE
jgi:hypothetical protein